MAVGAVVEEPQTVPAVAPDLEHPLQERPQMDTMFLLCLVLQGQGQKLACRAEMTRC